MNNRWARVVGILLSAVLATGACSGARGDKPTARSVTTTANGGQTTTVGTTSSTPVVETSTSAPVEVTIADATTPTVVEAGGVKIEFPAGALDAAARVTVASATAGTLPEGFLSAGTGIKVDLGGRTLAKPAVVSFPASAQPDGTVPVAMHINDAGLVNVLPAEYRDGRIVVSTSDFSIQLPSWLDPVSWFKSAFRWLANDVAGLRTSPPSCAAVPSSVTDSFASTDLVHQCTRINSNGEAELVIKSNRPTWLEVRVPQPNRWVWIESMSDWVTAAARRVGAISDANSYWLPPGKTMTVGLVQSENSGELRVPIGQTNETIALSAVTALLGGVDALEPLADVGLFIKTFYSDSHFTSSGFKPSLSKAFGLLVDFGSKLSNSGVGLGILKDVYGPDYELSLGAARVDSVATKLQKIGVVAKTISWALIALRAVDIYNAEIAAIIVDQFVSVDIAGSRSGSTSTSATTSAPTTATTLRPPPGSLGATLTENPFTCDDGLRPIGTITGALPGETIDFTSPTVGGLLPGTADGAGNRTIRWQCAPGEGGQTWQVTASGRTSGRSVTFGITGVSPTTPTTQPPALGVALTENPFTCDNGLRLMGTVTGAQPGETIDFTSPTVGGLLPGTADGAGNRTIRWQCAPGEGGQTWQVTARGRTSGRSVTFGITGVNPAAPPPPPAVLAVSFSENPYRCDNGLRLMGTVTGAQPGETIDFTSPTVGGLLPGAADGAGNRTIRWQCAPNEAGQAWSVTARGRSSGRTVTFTIAGR